MKKIIKITIDGIEETGKISDGYHTFDELYDHRIGLYISLCKTLASINAMLPPGESYRSIWRSKLHGDGSSFEGWFILGINKVPGQQITYHLPLSRWDETDFAAILEKAPEFDGHTPVDVLERLKKL